MRGSVRVAAVQLELPLGQAEENLRKMLRCADEAADRGARLVAFPECSHNGYVFRDVGHAYELATAVPGDVTRALGRKAAERGIYLAVGLAERGGPSVVYNSAVILDPAGEIALHYRKHFLHSVDRGWFVTGDLGHPILETELGRIGVFICADGRIPENARCLALKGSDILLNLTNWGSPDQYLYHVPTRAIENGVFMVAADKVGVEPPYHYPGHSFIMGPRGEMLAEASTDREETIYADIDPTRARDKRLGPRNDLFHDRRPETYGLMAAPVAELPITRLLQEPIVAEEMAIQLSVIQVDHREPNLDRALEMVRFAATVQADLVVLPELFAVGGQLGSRAQAAAAAARMDEIVSRLARIAADHTCYVVAGLVEPEGDRLYNTAVLVGPEGVAGRYRKNHLWGPEKEWLEPGNLGYPVFRTPFGNLGVMVGYDGLFPEVARILMLQGADVIAWPANWTDQVYPRHLVVERAMANRVFLAAASGAGGNGESPAIGQSTIVDPYGRILARAGAEGRAYLQSRTVDLCLSRVKKIGPGTSVCDRKPELYGCMVQK